jgi:hypothetical protein
MASYADAYGYTPQEFMSLTLPNIANFGEYAQKQAEDMEKSSSKGGFNHSSSSTGSFSRNSHNSSQGKWKSSTSLESLIGQYGTKEAKNAVFGEMVKQPPKDDAK